MAGPAAPARRDGRARRRRPGAQQPVPGSARPGDSAHCADLGGDRRAVAGPRQEAVVRQTSKGGYGTTLHRDYDGEFDYDLQWKPLGGFPVTFGWINAVRRGQARLHRGLDVGVPNLILRSDHSVAEDRRPGRLDPARRRGARRRPDRPLGRLHRQPHHRRSGRRRQTRCVPVAAGAARGRLPRTGRVAGRLPGARPTTRRLGIIRTRGEYAWRPSTSRSSEPVRATAFSTSATPTSGWRSASRARSAAPASTSGASRPRCSSTPPRSPKTIRECRALRRRRAHRQGALGRHRLAGVRPHRSDRAGGEEYRRSSPNVDGVRQPHPVRPDSGRRALPAAHRRRRRVHRRSGGDRGGLAGDDSRRRSSTAASRTTPATPSCGSPSCPSIW